MTIQKKHTPTHTLATATTAIALATVLASCSAVSANSKTSSKLANPQSSRVAISEINWGKTPFGPLASPVYGDFSKGKHITLIKFPAGTKTPVHTHTHDYIGVVISGVTRHYLPGKPSTMTKLPAGSHWSIPANIEHI